MSARKYLIQNILLFPSGEKADPAFVTARKPDLKGTSLSVTTETITIDEAAHRLNICVGSVKCLIRSGVLAATQLMPSAPWQIPAAALDTDAVRVGVRKVMARP